MTVFLALLLMANLGASGFFSYRLLRALEFLAEPVPEEPAPAEVPSRPEPSGGRWWLATATRSYNVGPNHGVIEQGAFYDLDDDVARVLSKAGYIRPAHPWEVDHMLASEAGA